MFFFHIQALVCSLLMQLFGVVKHLFQYNIFSLVFSWFALANIWLTFSIIIDLLPSQNIIIFGTADIVRSSSYNYSVVLTICSDSLGQPGFQVDIPGFPCVTSE